MRRRSVLLIWIVGILAGAAVTAVFVYAAYQIRGYWAYGGEYAPLVLSIPICTILADGARHHNRKLDKESTGMVRRE